MDLENTKISFRPANMQLEEIKSWLIDEEKKSREGFYCNWHIIEKSIENNKIAIVSENDKTIGFVTWSCYDDFYAVVDIMEIKPSHRKQGFGKKLISYLIEHLIKKNIYVAELQCAPASSEKVWRKFGFIDFPENNGTTNWNYGNKKLYKILIDNAKISKVQKSKEHIQLWNIEPNRSINTDPIVSFELEFVTGSRNLSKPIVYPCSRDWRIKWSHNALTVKDDKIKYFTKGNVVFGNFLVINSLPVIIK